MQIFLSHSSADKPLARRIREQLMAQGLSVWIDEAQIRVGQSIPDEIQRAISASDILCILISTHSINSKWVNRELNSFLPLFINSSKFLVPCKLDSSAMPLLIQDIKYADFSESFDIGIIELLNAVKIKEEIEKKNRLKPLLDQVLSEFSENELNFFLNWERFEDTEYTEDWEEIYISLPPELHKLISFGLADSISGCHGACSYYLSKNGAEIQKIIKESL